MKEESRAASIIIRSIVGATTFAVIMTIFDYIDERDVTIWKFLLYFFSSDYFGGYYLALGEENINTNIIK